MKAISIFPMVMLIAAYANVTAQPILTASTTTPNIGLSNQIFSTSQFNPGTAGTNQVWDFSTQTYTYEGNQDFEACSAANNCSSFPGTTYVGNVSSGAPAGYIYYGGTSSAISITGHTEATYNVFYADKEDFYRFPFTFGNSYVDKWNATYNNASAMTSRWGVDSVFADGWGKLKTPSGTFNNVLRIKRIRTYVDSAVLGGNLVVVNYKEQLYTFNDIAHKDYLYSTSTLTTVSTATGTNTTTYSRYHTAIPTAGLNNAGKGISCQVGPNPVKDNIYVKIQLDAAGYVSFTLTDLAGRVVRDVPVTMLSSGDNKVTISVNGLSKGMYLINATSKDFSKICKVIIE